MSCCQNNKETLSDSTVYNYQYQRLKNTGKTTKCEASCFCRFIEQPSTWDQMQSNWLEKGGNLNVPPASASFIRSWGAKTS